VKRNVYHTNPSWSLTSHFVLMALVSGPGRGGGGGLSTAGAPHGLELTIDKHVEYIRKLDTVRVLVSNGCALLMTLTEER
jgi:hypothetical protein